MYIYNNIIYPFSNSHFVVDIFFIINCIILYLYLFYSLIFFFKYLWFSIFRMCVKWKWLNIITRVIIIIVFKLRVWVYLRVDSQLFSAKQLNRFISIYTLYYTVSFPNTSKLVCNNDNIWWNKSFWSIKSIFLVIVVF